MNQSITSRILILLNIIRNCTFALVVVIGFSTGLPQPVMSQVPTVADAVNRVLLHVEGTPPVWETPPAKKSMITVMNDNEFKDFILTLKRLKTWYDDNSLSRLDQYLTLAYGIEESPGISTFVADLKLLRELIVNELSTSTRLTSSPLSSTRPVQANFSHSFIVSSSLGLVLSSATITVTPRKLTSNSSRTREQGAIVLTHMGTGEYVFSAPADVSIDYDVEVTAPGHVTKSVKLPLLQGRTNVELIHEDYVARCNDIIMGWTSCDVDPDRLIETFGIVERTLMNSEVRGQNTQTLDVQLNAYLPEITNDGMDYLSRKAAYYEALSLHSKIFALTVSNAVTRSITSIYEDDVVFDPAFNFDKLTLYGLGMLVPEVDNIFEIMSNSGVSPSTIDSKMGENLQKVFLFASYQTSLNLYFATLRERMKSTWLDDDRAFIAALEQVEFEHIDDKYDNLLAFAGSFADKSTDKVLLEILIGESHSFTVNRSNGLRGILADPKLLTSGMINDLMKQSNDQSELKSLLMVTAQIDRELFVSIPDAMTAIKSGLDSSMLHLMVMRASLGLFYNEIRAVTMNGEKMKWAVNSWQYNWPEIESESQAYKMAMARSSIRKSEVASNMMRQILNSIAIPKVVVIEPID